MSRPSPSVAGSVTLSDSASATGQVDGASSRASRAFDCSMAICRREPSAHHAAEARAGDLARDHFDPPHSFSWETSLPGMRILATHRVEAIPSGTRMTLEINAAGPLTDIFAVLTSGMTKRYVAMEAEGIMRRVEGGHG